MLDRRGENHSGVKPLSFVEIQELARAVVAAGDSFYCRRLLQRLDREVLELHECWCGSVPSYVRASRHTHRLRSHKSALHELEPRSPRFSIVMRGPSR